jgi:non-ribosomal peptide synthetase component F
VTMINKKNSGKSILRDSIPKTSYPSKEKESKQEVAEAVKESCFTLEKGIKEKLDVFLKERRVTLAAFFYCAWGILLQKYCGSDDVVFGTTVSGRSAPINGIENMVGLFINTLPLRVTAKIDETTSDLLLKVNETLLHREKHENTPLVEIREYSPGETGQELFDTLLVIENYPLDHFLQGEDKNLPLTVHSYSTVESTNYDLNIAIALHGDIEVRLIYSEEFFSGDVIYRLSRHFSRILSANHRPIPHVLFHALELLSGEEKKQLLLDFNDTGPWFSYG